ncbi:hypothetical protein G6F70_002018 [Rhizopus microsporus]|uniref:Ubiquitin carboxyl-terminal hydrolase n=2 Tax=Rhizopus TaxID=4842 RepID=A0A367JLG9_RHIAZ|nr:hypothetical protein G6F71_006704 [Rhizopus microsporus]RCH90766.1 hypothetical protein CU097_009873 [Rhizopus azygosporus]KAG1202693.1 hypothetical protein G6F70_002018 [Rhizopus microsporus]KAG1209083.1 hypothetical protein G6F69_006660 [Rhizopus microsporus]KAG1228500.1 hypothetical protein G6F67_007780 [Rhizopus microsporus]
MTHIPGSSLSPLSPPSPFQHPDQKTVYDVIYADSNPSHFYGESHLIQTGACPHLTRIKQKYKQEGEDENSILENYRSLIQYSISWHKSKQEIEKKRKHRKELPFPKCSVCSDPLSRLHACLHCVFMGCWRKGHMKEHQMEKEHCFAVDFDRHTIFCYECNDYVYDVEINEKITKAEIVSSRSRRKKQRVQYALWEPTEKDISTIVNNSVIASCQGLRGLCNMGNTCFMNVILQSLVHNPILKAYFLSDKHNSKRCKRQHCMCCEMDDLFIQLYSGDKQPYGPCRFLQTMWMSLKELAGYAQQDAHEFFISALNNIHAGCEESKLSNCECIIHKTFSGLLQSTVTCLRCKNTTTTYDPMLDISLGLKAPEKKKKHLGNGRRHSHEDRRHGNTLADCLERYTQPERLGANVYSCSKCGNTFQEATKQLSIKRIPPVLSIQLKRFEHSTSISKIETKIKFPIDLDLTPYTANKNKNSDNVYTLFAVVNHHGKVDTGHYTMFAKHRNEWFKFDDHSVTFAYQKDVLDSKAYMCFYIKKSLEFSDKSLQSFF